MLKALTSDGRPDLRRLCELVPAARSATLHAGDLQSKLCDPSLRPARDVRAWEDGGELVGLAFVQPSCSEFNLLVRECARAAEVEARAMEWALARFERAAAERGPAAVFVASAGEHDAGRAALFERFGLTPDGSACVYLHRPLDSPVPPPAWPEGFAVRHLGDARAVAAYVEARRAAFWAEGLTEEWHRRVRGAPAYVPELDLVAVAPDGTFAACGLSWLEAAPGGAKLGYVQTLGTRPRFRKAGLGRALFLETLSRLRALGAGVAVGQADAVNAEALRLYESAGVRPLHRIRRYLWTGGGRASAAACTRPARRL